MNCLKTHLEISSPPHVPGGLATVMHSAFVCGQEQELPFQIIYMKGLHAEALVVSSPHLSLLEKWNNIVSRAGSQCTFLLLFLFFFFFEGKASSKSSDFTVFEPLCCWHFFPVLTAK